MSGVVGTLLDSGTRLTGGDNWPYETTEQVFVTADGVPVHVRALDPGGGGNKVAGDSLSLDAAISGIDGEAPVILIDGGVDPESDERAAPARPAPHPAAADGRRRL